MTEPRRHVGKNWKHLRSVESLLISNVNDVFDRLSVCLFVCPLSAPSSKIFNAVGVEKRFPVQ